MITSFKKAAQIGATVALMGTLSACAAGARPEAMTVLPSTIVATQPQELGYKAMTVETVEGGSTSNPLWTPKVSNEEFRRALETSLQATNYLGETASAPLKVSATLVQLKQPLLGLDLTVTSQVRYSVKDQTGASIFDETLTATGTGRVSDSLGATERLRLANEASIRENIRSFIERFRATRTR